MTIHNRHCLPRQDVRPVMALQLPFQHTKGPVSLLLEPLEGIIVPRRVVMPEPIDLAHHTTHITSADMPGRMLEHGER